MTDIDADALYALGHGAAETDRSHLADPNTVAMFGFMLLTWGRKPG